MCETNKNFKDQMSENAGCSLSTDFLTRSEGRPQLPDSFKHIASTHMGLTYPLYLGKSDLHHLPAWAINTLSLLKIPWE